MSDQENRNMLMSVYGTGNEARVKGVIKFASDVKADYGDDGVAAAEKWLDRMDSTELFEGEEEAEKTASDFAEEYGIDQETFQGLDLQGRIIAHAMMDEMSQSEKLTEHTASLLREKFEKEVVNR